MRHNQHPTFGFTTRANGIARELTNQIYISEFHDEGSPEPIKRPYKAIWDTGATNSVITRKVAQELNLTPSGRAPCQVVGAADQLTTHDTDTFLVDIYLPNNVHITGVRVSEMSVGGGDVLLGMDIIALGDFAVTSHNGQTWWTFRVPSNEPIDFVKEINDHNQRHQPQGGTPRLQEWLDKNRKKQGMRKRKRK